MAKYNVHGTQLQMSDMEATPAFATIAQVNTMTLPPETRGSEDVPTHDDTVGTVADKIVDALFSIGQVTFTIVEDWGDGTHDGSTGLEDAKADTVARDFKFILADSSSTEIAFSGWIVDATPQELPANRGTAQKQYGVIVTGGRPTIT